MFRRPVKYAKIISNVSISLSTLCTSVRLSQRGMKHSSSGCISSICSLALLAFLTSTPYSKHELYATSNLDFPSDLMKKINLTNYKNIIRRSNSSKKLILLHFSFFVKLVKPGDVGLLVSSFIKHQLYMLEKYMLLPFTPQRKMLRVLIQGGGGGKILKYILKRWKVIKHFLKR